MIFVTNDDVMGKNIRYLRQLHGLSLQIFAARMGIEPDDLEAIESGRLMEIDGRVLHNICRFFHIPMEALVEIMKCCHPERRAKPAVEESTQ